MFYLVVLLFQVQFRSVLRSWNKHRSVFVTDVLLLPHLFQKTFRQSTRQDDSTPIKSEITWFMSLCITWFMELSNSSYDIALSYNTHTYSLCWLHFYLHLLPNPKFRFVELLKRISSNNNCLEELLLPLKMILNIYRLTTSALFKTRMNRNRRLTNADTWEITIELWLKL